MIWCGIEWKEEDRDVDHVFWSAKGRPKLCMCACDIGGRRPWSAEFSEFGKPLSNVTVSNHHSVDGALSALAAIIGNLNRPSRTRSTPSKPPGSCTGT